MIRRLIIGFGIVLSVLVVASILMALWLVGKPLASQKNNSLFVMDSPYYGDLIPRPPTDIHGVSRYLWDIDRGGAQTAPEKTFPQITRIEKHSTPPLRHTLNCLLVGLDRPRAGRTDTIVVAVFDRNSDHIGLISVPRDLYVDVPDFGPARINAAYSIGRRQGRNGLKVLAGVIEKTLAIPIHHSIAVDLNVFERSVNALGGVRVDVPCPIIDNFLDSRTESGRRMLDVKAGRQLMDGYTAAMYARSRHGRSDWDRARRQQAVLLGMRHKLLSSGGLGRVPALWDQMSATVTTDMNRLELLRLVNRGARADLTQIHGLVIGYHQTEHFTTPEGRWVLLPKFDEIDRALGSLFSAPSPGLRPRNAKCPAADVAITRPKQRSLRRKMRALRRAQKAKAHSLPYSTSGSGASSSERNSSSDGVSSTADSYSDHSSSSDSSSI